MWIEEEIEAHHEWKIKLNDYAANCDQSITVEHVCFDHTCRLGKEIKYFKDKDTIQFEEMDELIKEHRAFHRVLGELVKNINNGVKLNLEMSFGPHSAFSKHLKNLEKLLIKLSKLMT
jgi:hypothetical protein